MMICTSCCKLGEFTSLIQLCLRILESASFSCMELSSESFALPWGWGSLSVGSSGAVLSHSPPFAWALPPAWPVVHGWSTDNQRQKPQFPVKSPLNLVFAQMASKPWVIFQMLMCCITPSHMFEVFPCLPQLLALPGDLASPTVSWGTEHLAGRDCASAPPVRRGCGKSSQSGCWGLCRLSSHPCLCTISMGSWGGGRVFLCWF